MSENKEVKTPTIHSPHVDTIPAHIDGPYTSRNYSRLDQVDEPRLRAAAAFVDGKINANETNLGNEADPVDTTLDVVYAPLGGVLDCQIKGLLQEAVIVPPPFTSGPDAHQNILGNNQIPLMIDELPPLTESEDDTLVGRIPTIEDLIDSASGQEKSFEQVLAVPAEAILRDLIAPASEEGSPYVPSNITNLLFNSLAFIRRGWCETDRRFVQFLPYVYYWKKSEFGIKIFTYQRGKGSGEGRLALNCSIGTGGHINPVDFFSMKQNALVGDLDVEKKNNSRNGDRILSEGFWSGVVNSILREGCEEVMMTDGKNNQVDLLDLINTSIARTNTPSMSHEEWIQRRTALFLDYNANDVEKVHLGMFIGIEVPEDFEIVTAEEVLVDVGFRELSDLYKDSVENPLLPTRLECWSRSLVESLYETIMFCRENSDQIPSVTDRFRFGTARKMGIHSVEGDVISKIAQQDRWKIGTLAGSMSADLSLYAMNVFVRA